MHSPLGEVSREVFLQQYWQQKVLVVRNAFADFTSLLSPEELAGLACDEDVTAKIVIEKGGDHPWQVLHSPFTEETFTQLPGTHWTLLVNDVEKHIPEFAAVVDNFRFIPEWRFDDLMISYAPEGGSVGPHLDQYDVFILQAMGHRRWQIHTQEVHPDNQVAETELRIQRDFQVEEEWVLAPGDMIYIPPGVSHYGVALDDCMSFSIGFRAPSHAEMLTSFIEYLSKDLPHSLTYKDHALCEQEHPNQISADVLKSLTETFRTQLQVSPDSLQNWFGRFVSDPQSDLCQEAELQYEHFDDVLQKYPVLYRHPASRFAFVENGNQATLFVDGEDYPVSTQFAQELCRKREVLLGKMYNMASKKECDLLLHFFNTGKLYVDR